MRHPQHPRALARLNGQVPGVGHDELQCQRFENRDLGAHGVGHVQVGLIAPQRLGPDDSAGLPDRRRGEPSDEFTGQPLQCHGRRQRPVILAHPDDDGQLRQPPGGGLQVVDLHPAAVDRGAQSGQRRGGVLVGQHSKVDAAGHHAVLDVVHRIRDVVGPVHDLGLQTRPAVLGTGAHPGSDAGVIGVEAEFPAVAHPLPGVLGDGVE